MTSAVLAWFFFRVVRWLSWIVFFAYGVYFVSDRSPHLNSFGQLLPSTEAVMFGSALCATFAGFLELMMRERAGLQRPNLGHLIPPRAETTSSSMVRE
jgi:hypothetical protein